VLYRIHRRPALYVQNRPLLTHAWLPRDRLDAVVERGGWVFAWRGDGWLALRSKEPSHWNDRDDAGEDRARELVAHGREHVWICELGRRATDGSFENFVERIAAAPVAFAGLSVRYDSPSQRRLELGWNRPLRRAGRVVAQGDFARYDAPWCRAAYPADAIDVRCGGHELHLAWPTATRRMTRSVTQSC